MCEMYWFRIFYSMRNLSRFKMQNDSASVIRILYLDKFCIPYSAKYLYPLVFATTWLSVFWMCWRFGLRESRIKQLAIIQFRMSKCCGYRRCNFQIKIKPCATMVTNVIAAGFTEGRNLIVIKQVRIDYETEIPGKVNWCQTNTRSKQKWMTFEFGKLLWSAN